MNPQMTYVLKTARVYLYIYKKTAQRQAANPRTPNWYQQQKGNLSRSRNHPNPRWFHLHPKAHSPTSGVTMFKTGRVIIKLSLGCCLINFKRKHTQGDYPRPLLNWARKNYHFGQRKFFFHCSVPFWLTCRGLKKIPRGDRVSQSSCAQDSLFSRHRNDGL